MSDDMNDRQYSDAKSRFVDGFNIIDCGGVKTVEMKLFEPENGLKHGFSTRVGGISERPYDTMNLSLSREGEAGSVMKNLLEILGIVAAFVASSVMLRITVSLLS